MPVGSEKLCLVEEGILGIKDHGVVCTGHEGRQAGRGEGDVGFEEARVTGFVAAGCGPVGFGRRSVSDSLEVSGRGKVEHFGAGASEVVFAVLTHLHDVGESEVENNPEHDDDNEQFDKAESGREWCACFHCPIQLTVGALATPQEENCRLAPAPVSASLLTALPLPLSAA